MSWQTLKQRSVICIRSDYNIGEVVEYSIKNALYYFENLKLSDQDKSIADQILKEIISRLSFLNNVGLEYLTLDRSSGTLSGGSTTYSFSNTNWFTINRSTICFR